MAAAVVGLAVLALAGCRLTPPAPDREHTTLVPSCFTPRLGASSSRDAARVDPVRPPDFLLRPGEILRLGPRETGAAGWMYEPALSAGTVDFAAAAMARQGLVQNADGVCGPGSCEIPFFLPAPVAAGTNGGARLTLGFTGRMELAVADPFGCWMPVNGAEGGGPVDLTPLLAGRQTFALRLTVGAAARLTSFRFEAALQPERDQMPALCEGANVFELLGKDRYGLASLPYELPVDFRPAAAVPLVERVSLRGGAVAPVAGGGQVIRPRGPEPLEATVEFEAPSGTWFSWFELRVELGEGNSPDPTGSPLNLAWQGGDHREFRPVTEFVPVGTAGAGRATFAGRVLFGRSERTVRFRLTSARPILALRGIGHLERPGVLAVRPQLVHRWLEQGAEHRFAAPAACDCYFFRCGPAPSGHRVEMSLPSRMIPIVNSATPALL